jgi:gliding motility-associated-like protein
MKLLFSDTCLRLKLALLISVFLSSYTAMAQPGAAFTATPINGCAPLAVSFTDQSTGNPTAWSWDLGNGTTSTQQNPTTTYFNSGLYTITLTVTNTAGSNTLTKTQYIRVDDKPVVDFSASNTAGCFPLRVNFTDLSAGGSAAVASWEWDFGDGFTSTQQNPFHIYTTAGNYTVTLKVTNAGGCSRVVSRPNYIQVSPGVTVAFSNSLPAQCKPPETITFTSASTGPGVLTYEWLFGDGNNAFAQNTAHTYVTGGSFTVSLIVQSSLGCVDTLVKPALLTIKDVVSDFTAPATVCLGAPASFSNASSPVSAGSFWDFGDGTFSAAANPVKVYTATGTFNVKLRNDYGTCFDSVIKPITVLPLPVPNFTAPDVTDCKVPFTVNFTNLSAGAVSWQWDFGDGGTSNLQNPSHTYTTLGNYTVKLVVTGANGCSDSIIQNQFVRIQAPVVAINGLPQEGCVPYTAALNANVTAVDGVLTYLWDFGDGFTAATANPSHIYPNQGTYTVKLFITTNDGCTDSSVRVNAITVGNKPVADFSAAPLAQCVAQQVQFTNLTVPSDRWLWDFGNGTGTSALQNPSYAYPDTGTYTIRLIAWNNGCADTVIKTNFITALPPIARFSLAYNCGNKLQVSFTDQSVLPQTWLWNFGDGNTSTAANPVHTYSVFGSYTVTLTVTNGTCSNTYTGVVNLSDETANFTIIDDTICNNQVAVFQSFGFNQANIVNYFWDYGDGQSEYSGFVATHVYTTPGLYTVRLTITDTKGCVSTITKNNAMRVWGTRPGFTFNPITGCRPLTVTFTDTTLTDGVHPIVNWRWSFGDGTIQNYTAPPFTHLYDTTGLFQGVLTVTDSYGCTNTFFSPNLVYITSPKAIFNSPDTATCPGSTVRFNNSSTGASLTYFWDFGDGTNAVTANPVKTYAADGDYTVSLTVTDINGCTNTSTQTAYIKVHTVQPSLSVSDSVSSCTPFEVNFTNTSLYSVSAVWHFGDGSTSTLPNPTHYYSLVGTYNVKLVVTGPGGCTDSVFKTITVYPSTATLTYAPLSGCSPLPVTFHVSTPGPVTYLWDFNDGNTLATTDSNIVYNYLLPGNFLPKVILEDQTGCQIPVVGIDTIFVTKSLVNFAADDSLHCGTGLVNFSDSTITNAAVAGYRWDFGDGGTSAQQNPSHTYTAPGLYTVRLIVTTANGCSDTAIKTNYIKVVAVPNGDITGNTPICLYNKLTFGAVLLQPDTAALRWFWDFGNGKTSDRQNPPAQSYDTAGSYPLRLIITNSSGCADTINRTVTIYPLPVIEAGPNRTIIVGASTVITPTGSPVVDYLWSPATDLSCTNCYSTTASPKNTTTYSIRVTDANGCVNTDKLTVIVLCNDNNIFIPNTFSPNNDGVNDIFFPRGTGLFKIQAMRIFNRWGEMVFQKNNVTPNDPAGGWNGRHNGRLLTSDVYTYVIEIVCENSEVLSYKGNITLIQ